MPRFPAQSGRSDPRKQRETMKQEPEVLIVEDSEEVLWMIGNVLDHAGFIVDAVTTGTEAIQKIKKSPEIKVIVLNFLLPDMTGVNVFEQVRKDGFKGEVIGTTGLIGGKEMFQEAGLFALLDKPFEITELVGLCKQALRVSNGSTGLARTNPKEKGGERIWQ